MKTKCILFSYFLSLWQFFMFPFAFLLILGFFDLEEVIPRYNFWLIVTGFLTVSLSLIHKIVMHKMAHSNGRIREKYLV